MVNFSLPPVIGIAPTLGSPLLYGSSFALSNAFNSWVLVSGGTSIRSTTTILGPDETWRTRSAAIVVEPDGSPVKFGDPVALAVPAHGEICFPALPRGVQRRISVQTRHGGSVSV
jgi:hypothetical protein